MNRAVFLDRDGVITQAIVRDGKAYSPRRASEFKILPGVEPVIRELARQGFVLIVISNQPDIARNKMHPADLEAMNQRLMEALGGDGGIREIKICPHDNADGCSCRKPKPGMLLEAAGKYELDLQKSFMVGDRGVDIEAGRAAGCRTILIEASYNQGVEADFKAADLKKALGVIQKEAER